MDTELEIRMAAFRWLAERERSNMGVFAGRKLNEGFKYGERRITLKGQTGIWFPQGFSVPISITTKLNRPYDLDAIGDDGILAYAYRGIDPNHRDNRGLREAMRTRTPLIYFNETRDSMYQAAWPVIIIGDDPAMLCVRAVIDPAYMDVRSGMELGSVQESPLDLRRYITVETRRRLHQAAFRDMVIHAYDEQCTICRLHHPGLLDGAHIIADSEDMGTPVVTNGLSLCKIHHAAYDQNILGIDPDYRVRIRGDILLERDGPMLKHGIQELEGSTIVLPRHRNERPDRERLAERFRQFRIA